jgi:hypothetical protein
MGFFKDSKDAIKGAKELGDYHGGMPSMSSALKDVKAVTDDRGQNEILKSGTPAKARVLGFALPVPDDRFAMQIQLEIHPPTGDPYPVNYVFPSARMKAPLSAGMEVPVKISATDPQAVAVQWDALKGSIAASGGDMAAVTQGLANTYQGTADAAGRAYLAGQAAGQQQAAEQKPAEAADDPAARIKKAQQLLDAGLISAEEFEAKRQEILGSL